jgi:hypothetical protein
MTPQDKAKQIIERYESGLTIKDCALIAVDLILTALDAHQWQNRQEIDYWNEVKQEIKKL